MMTGMGKGLPPRVFEKHGRYYHVRADGQRRIWTPLTRVRDGMPALYRSLAEIENRAVVDDRMTSVIQRWMTDVMPRHSQKTQVDDTARCLVISAAFADFRADQVQASDASEFLRQYRDRPRTHNAYRAMLRELLRYSIELGYRQDQPMEHVRTLPTPARTRYITDCELRRIRRAACIGDDGRRTRSGTVVASLIEVAYLTGQRIGDLLALRWSPDPGDPDAPHVAADGLRFRPAKTRRATGAAVLIEWTPRLREVIERLRRGQAERLLKKRADQRKVSGYVFTTQDGGALTYSGASTAWKRAVKRAGVKDVHFHDLRAKALTDKDALHGRHAANVMGTHSTEAQTADYIRHRTTRRTAATR